MNKLADFFGSKNKAHTIVITILLLVSLMVSILAIFTRQLGANMDETIHYSRSIQIANGDLRTTRSNVRGGYISKTQYDFRERSEVKNKIENNSLSFSWKDETISKKDVNSEPVFVDTTSAYPYNPLVYTPFSLASGVAKATHMSVAWEVLLMRMFGLVFLTVAIIFAIRIVPFGKIAIAAFSVHPIIILAKSAITADTVTIGISLVFIAMTLDLLIRCLNKKVVPIKYLTVYAMLILGLSVVKIPFSFMSLIALPIWLYLFRSRSINSDNKKLLIIIVAVVTSLLFSAVWLYMVKDINTGVFWGRNVDTWKQLRYIISNPVEFIQTFLFNISNYNPFEIYLAAAEKGRYIIIPNLLTLAYYFSIFLLVAADIPKTLYKKMKEKAGLIFAFNWFVCLIIIAAVFGILYLQFSEIGSRDIMVQARYLLPIWPLMFLSTAIYSYKKMDIREVLALGIIATLPALILVTYTLIQI